MKGLAAMAMGTMIPSCVTTTDIKTSQEDIVQRPLIEETNLGPCSDEENCLEAITPERKVSTTPKNLYGRIDNVWVDHNVYLGEEKGMNIHTRLRVNNRKGRHLGTEMRFFTRDGYKLMDKDGLNASKDGQVFETSATLIPKYDDSKFCDIRTFLPYDQLDIKKAGLHSLRFDTILFDYQDGVKFPISKTYCEHFKYNLKK